MRIFHPAFQRACVQVYSVEWLVFWSRMKFLSGWRKAKNATGFLVMGKLHQLIVFTCIRVRMPENMQMRRISKLFKAIFKIHNFFKDLPLTFTKHHKTKTNAQLGTRYGGLPCIFTFFSISHFMFNTLFHSHLIFNNACNDAVTQICMT